MTPFVFVRYYSTTLCSSLLRADKEHIFCNDLLITSLPFPFPKQNVRLLQSKSKAKEKIKGNVCLICFSLIICSPVWFNPSDIRRQGNYSVAGYAGYEILHSNNCDKLGHIQPILWQLFWFNPYCISRFTYVRTVRSWPSALFQPSSVTSWAIYSPNCETAEISPVRYTSKPTKISRKGPHGQALQLQSVVSICVAMDKQKLERC